MILKSLPCFAQAARGLLHDLDLLPEATEGIEDGAVSDRLDKRAIIMLAVDFDEGRPDRLQNLHTDWLIVDERAGRSIGYLDATQNQIAVDVDIRI